jgi:hypothetical protein
MTLRSTPGATVFISCAQDDDAARLLQRETAAGGDPTAHSPALVPGATVASANLLGGGRRSR